MPVFTHERIDLSGGVLGKLGTSPWGDNALQTITIGRHTPKDPYQAIGFLGIVDYGSGIITSDVTLDCILVEGCRKAGVDIENKGTSVYRYAGQNIVIGTENYVATSFGLGFSAGAPATFSVGYITATIASYLDFQDQPVPESGEESSFAVVMGDDGSGIKLVATWDGIAPASGTVPILSADGSLGTVDDSSIPAGVQSINLNATINRDQILDVRSAQPTQFVTTYPVDVTCDMEVLEIPYTGTNRPGEAGYQPDTQQASPYGATWKQLLDLSVVATALNKHNSAGGADTASENDLYCKVIGLQKVDESETISVGQFLSYTVNFTAADLLVPMPSLYSGGAGS